MSDNFEGFTDTDSEPVEFDFDADEDASVEDMTTGEPGEGKSDDTEEESSSKSRSESGAKKKSGMSRQAIRKIAEKTVEVASVDQGVTSALGELFGMTDPSDVDLVAEIMTSRPADARVVVDALDSLRAASGFEKVHAVSGIAEPTLKKLWGLFHARKLVDRANPPKDSLKAAIAVAEASDGFTDADYDLFVSAVELAKKA